MAGGASPFQDDDMVRMITDINVTPLVDIILVVLIIFMVTTSYIVNPTIKVDLPKAATGSEQTPSTLGLTLTKEGKLFLNGAPTTDEQIARTIAEELPKKPDLQAIIAADKVVPHGQVVHLIDLVRRAGVRRFAINVDSEAPGTSPSPALTGAAAQ